MVLSSNRNKNSPTKTVNASTQTLQDINIVESDLPSRVQEIADMNSELQEQISEICSIIPNDENITAKIRQMKENEDKLRKIFKSEDLVQSATELSETKKSIESIISEVSNGNQNELASFIAQLVSENEQRKQIIEEVQKETDE